MAVVYGAKVDQAVAGETDELPPRSIARAIGRGCLGRCPNCGEGRIFKGYTTVTPECAVCGEELYHHRADDFPPYLSMIVVGHVVVAGMLILERGWHPPLWVHSAIWLPLTVILSLVLLPIFKGGIIGLQWALYMHGFDKRRGEDMPEPDPAAALARPAH
jgi:uncharacterized protein (DUF983 family)